VTEQPIRFLRLQGIARDWSKHNEHSRNIFSVHGFLRLSVTFLDTKSIFGGFETNYGPFVTILAWCSEVG